MKLKTARESYDYYSETASEVARNLAFAGIAVVWLFTVVTDGNLMLSGKLLFGIFFFVLSLALDLLHYAISALIWGAYARMHEHEGSGDSKIVRPNDADIPDPPNFVNWPALAFFWLKIISVAVGYLSLLADLVGRIAVA